VIVSVLAAYLFLRHIDLLEFAWLFALCGLVVVGVPALAAFAARARTALAFAAAVLAVIALGLLRSRAGTCRCRGGQPCLRALPALCGPQLATWRPS